MHRYVCCAILLKKVIDSGTQKWDSLYM
jgi:hypothetical protein